jgi:hypothetical protein
VALEYLREQPQAVGARQPVQFLAACAGQAGVAGPAGDEHRAAPRTAREIAEEVGEADAFVVGVGAAEGGGAVVELRQRALEVVPDEQHLLLLHELDRAASAARGGSWLKFSPAT